jgi:uncharacterized protein (DUF1015 family)
MANETEDRVTYFKSEDEAVRAVDEQGALMAFIMNPTRIEEIIAVASELEKMPHKSTYFYPKLLSGLVLFRFEPGDKVKV